LQGFLAHATLWRALRKNQGSFSEYIATSQIKKRQAYYWGYMPLKSPIYYYDKNKILGDYFNNLNQNKFSFASGDKLL